jgi:hypothetical protein
MLGDHMDVRRSFSDIITVLNDLAFMWNKAAKSKDKMEWKLRYSVTETPMLVIGNKFFVNNLQMCHLQPLAIGTIIKALNDDSALVTFLQNQ